MAVKRTLQIADEVTPILSGDEKEIEQGDVLYYCDFYERSYRDACFAVKSYKVLSIDNVKRYLIMSARGYEKHIRLPDDTLKHYYKNKNSVLEIYRQQIDERIKDHQDKLKIFKTH